MVRRTSPPLHDSASEASELQRVLLVEDELDIQTVARMALEDLGGLDVEVCASGEDALVRGPAFRPQLVLLDYMMPGMNGRHTLEAFAAVPALAEVPIVFLTARAQLDEVAEYHRLGAIDVIIKPFDPMSLADEVQAVWTRYRAGSTVGSDA
ncbi:MAG: response regulator [Acidobacteriota bacterium]